MGKLRRWTPPLTETLEEPILNRVLKGLFPPPAEDLEEWTEPPLPEEGYKSWQESFKVTTDELKSAVRRMVRKNAAPGPRGIPAKVWAIIITELELEIKSLFSE